MKSSVTTNETNGKVTCINLDQECLESCHPLLSDKENKIIVKLSRRKDAESVLRNKNRSFLGKEQLN